MAAAGNSGYGCPSWRAGRRQGVLSSVCFPPRVTVRRSINSNLSSAAAKRVKRGAIRARSFGPILLLALAGGCMLPVTVRLHSRLGMEAFEAGDYGRAIDEFTTALERTGRRRASRVVGVRLARGRASLALARAALPPAPEPLSLRPVAIGLPPPGIDDRDDPLRMLHEAATDFQAAIADAPEGHPVRLDALRELALVRELQGRDTLAQDRYLELISLARGADPKQEKERALVAVARTRLGWLSLKRVAAGSEMAVLRSELGGAVTEALRSFEGALSIDPGDWSALLGQGICLTRVGRYEEAFAVLKRSLLLSESRDRRSPLARLYLAVCIEALQGHQREALDQLIQATEEDPDGVHLELYSHLVRDLGEYLQPGSPEYHEIFKALVAYRGNQPTYWSEVELICRQLIELDDFPLGLSQRGLAKSYARTGRVADAIDMLLELREQTEEFSTMLDDTFPPNSASPETIYARLRVLFEVGRYVEVEEATTRELPVDPISEYYYRIRGLIARNLFERWKEIVALKPDLGDNEHIREYYLLTARRILSGYVHRFPADVDAHVCLGEILEVTGDAEAALEHYCTAVSVAPRHARVFSLLRGLHSGSSLDDTQRMIAWKSLKTYDGPDAELRQYVREVLEAHRKNAARFCRGCGRQARGGEPLCLLCGAAVGAVEAAAVVER